MEAPAALFTLATDQSKNGRKRKTSLRPNISLQRPIKLIWCKTYREEMGVDETKGEEGEIGKDKEGRGKRRRGKGGE